MPRELNHSQRKQWNGEEALVRYFRPILKRFMRLARPEAFRSEEAMQEVFGYHTPRKRRYSKHDSDDRSGRVLVATASCGRRVFDWIKKEIA